MGYDNLLVLGPRFELEPGPEDTVAARAKRAGCAPQEIVYDEFLAAGSIPISLIRWEMTGLDDEIRRLW